MLKVYLREKNIHRENVSANGCKIIVQKNYNLYPPIEIGNTPHWTCYWRIFTGLQMPQLHSHRRPRNSKMHVQQRHIYGGWFYFRNQRNFFKPWNTVAQPEITMNAPRLHSGRNYTRIWVKKTIIEGLVIH